MGILFFEGISLLVLLGTRMVVLPYMNGDECGYIVDLTDVLSPTSYVYSYNASQDQTNIKQQFSKKVTKEASADELSEISTIMTYL